MALRQHHWSKWTPPVVILQPQLFQFDLGGEMRWKIDHSVKYELSGVVVRAAGQWKLRQILSRQGRLAVKKQLGILGHYICLDLSGL
jgi:hypothetical protein